jgi:hypothetical protein
MEASSMLSRLIDRPAGFMKKALRRTFLGPKAPAVRRYRPGREPDYWGHRFSNLTLSLQTPQPQAPRPGAPLHGNAPASGIRISHQGRVASCLASGI